MSGRREFLRTLGGGALGLALAGSGQTAVAAKAMRGVFPIGQTPVTASDKLDLDCLQNEVKFCNRYKVHGFAWPQIASGWTTLSENERMDGAEAILSAGKGGKTALVVRGVFKEDTRTRGGSLGGGTAPAGSGRGGRGGAPTLDEAAKQALRDAWDQFMKPHLRG